MASRNAVWQRVRTGANRANFQGVILAGRQADQRRLTGQPIPYEHVFHNRLTPPHNGSAIDQMGIGFAIDLPPHITTSIVPGRK